MQGSEVAQLREKIELEIQAMRSGLIEYAAVSRHDIINHKYDQLGTYVEQLHQHIGKAEAMEVVINALDQWGTIQTRRALTRKVVRFLSHFDKQV